MEQKSILIGGSYASLKMSVEVGTGILSVSSKFEFEPFEGKKGGFGMSSFLEQMFLLTEGHLERQFVFGIGRFLSEMDYQKSETEHQTATFLYKEYVGFCQKYHVEPISRCEFFKGLESLGFVVRPRMVNNETFVYCKKGEAAL